MTWYRSPTDEDKKIIAMSSEEYDKFMCESFPSIFRNRNKSASESCMHWGFGIGRGWRHLLYHACEKIRYMESVSDVRLIAEQVKEKFGGLRFYISFEGKPQDIVVDMPSSSMRLPSAEARRDAGAELVEEICSGIVDLICDATRYVCEDCGAYAHIRPVSRDGKVVVQNFFVRRFPNLARWVRETSYRLFKWAPAFTYYKIGWYTCICDPCLELRRKKFLEPKENQPVL